MSVVYPYDARVYAEFVDVQDLSILLTRRYAGVQSLINKIIKDPAKPVRVMWKPGPEPAGPGTPCFHVEDLKPHLGLSDDYATEILAFRRRALQDKVEISLTRA